MITVATYSKGGKDLERRLKPYDGHKVVIRLGGTMDYKNYDIQLNSVEAVMNCINKKTSKEIFLANDIPTLPILTEPQIAQIETPFVIKGIIRSKGSGVFVVENKDELKVYKKILHNQYYYEPLFQSTSEYRLHCTPERCFFATKKVKKEGYENDIIVNENNHKNIKDFLIPRRWKEMQEAAVKAVKALGMDIGGVDIGYCSLDKNNHTFVIHEVNSNPELLENQVVAYKAEIEKILDKMVK